MTREPMTAPFRAANQIRYDGDQITCQTGPDHANVGGTVHGGLLMTMLDAIMGGQVIRQLPEGRTCVTTSMTTHFLNPAFVGDDLVATATIRRVGNTLAYTDGVITRRGEDLPIATGTAVFALVPKSS